jgi:hypothetical protein
VDSSYVRRLNHSSNDNGIDILELTAQKIKDGVMSLKHMQTERLLLISRGIVDEELKNLVAMELEMRYPYFNEQRRGK